MLAPPEQRISTPCSVGRCFVCTWVDCGHECHKGPSRPAVVSTEPEAKVLPWRGQERIQNRGVEAVAEFRCPVGSGSTRCTAMLRATYYGAGHKSLVKVIRSTVQQHIKRAHPEMGPRERSLACDLLIGSENGRDDLESVEEVALDGETP